MCDRKNLSRFPALEGLDVDVFRPSAGSCANTVLYAPAQDCDLSAFRDVVVLDGPVLLPQTGNAHILSNASLTDMVALDAIDPSRETLLAVFAAVRGEDGLETGEDLAAAAKLLAGRGFGTEQLIFALAVFEELGLISLEGGRLRVFRGKRTELTNSRVYRAVSRMKGA